MSHEIILLVDDNRDIIVGLGRLLSRDDRSIVMCGDIESARLLVDVLPISHVVSDIRLTGPFEYEGLGLVQYVRERSPSTAVVLMTGQATPGLESEAKNRGSVAFLQKPFSIEELEEVIAACTAVNGRGECSLPELVDVPMFDDILRFGEITTEFQPIYRLDRANDPPFGFECLTRFRSDSPNGAGAFQQRCTKLT